MGDLAGEQRGFGEKVFEGFPLNSVKVPRGVTVIPVLSSICPIEFIDVPEEVQCPQMSIEDIRVASSQGKKLALEGLEYHEYLICKDGSKVLRKPSGHQVTSLSIPWDVCMIGNRCFDKCTALREVVFMPGCSIVTRSFDMTGHAAIRVNLTASLSQRL
jgi:hypothetical protein